MDFRRHPLPLKSLVLLLYTTSGPKSRVFVGLGNYAFLLRDPDFHKAVWNTTVFALARSCSSCL